MTNHDKLRLSSESSEDADDQDSPPRPLSEKSVNFLLNPRAEDEPAKPQTITELLIGKDYSKEKKHDSDEETDKSSSSKTKFRRSFKNLFKRIVSRDSSPAETPAPSVSQESAVAATAAESTVSKTMATEKGEIEPSENEPEPAVYGPESTPSETEGNELISHEEGVSENTAEHPDDNEPQATASNAATAASANQPPPPPNNPNIPPAPPASPPPPPLRPAAFGGAGGHGGPAVPPQVSAAPNLQPNTPAANPNVVVERRGGAGPLIAFLAANYLSKRRDRKIKRGVKKLETRLDESRQQNDAERRKTAAAEQASRLRATAQSERISQLESRQAVPPQETSSEQPPKTETLKPAVPIAEVLAAGAAAREITARPPEAPQPIEKLRPAPEVKEPEQKRFVPPPMPSRYERQTTEEKLSAEARERRRLDHEQAKAAEAQEATQERFFDRRHEVKDDPGAAPGPSMPIATIQTSAQPPADDHTQYLQSVQQKLQDQTTAQPPTQSDDDLYKKSIRNGFLMGMVVAILALIAVTLL